MPQRQMVIYSARTAQDAHFLKNLLADEHIRAVVINDSLEQGKGVDAVGWATAARVLVDEEDAQQARRIALEFDRRIATSLTEPSEEEPQEEPSPTVLHEWPTCPKCGVRRPTRCRICGTSGTEFTVADMGFILMSDSELPIVGAGGCSCGPGGCAPAESAFEPPPDEPSETATPVLLLMCPTCDEPFTPEYAGRCPSCGHEFGEGYEVYSEASSVQQVTSRVAVVVLGLVVLMLGAVAFFVMVLR